MSNKLYALYTEPFYEVSPIDEVEDASSIIFTGSLEACKQAWMDYRNDLAPAELERPYNPSTALILV